MDSLLGEDGDNTDSDFNLQTLTQVAETCSSQLQTPSVGLSPTAQSPDQIFSGKCFLRTCTLFIYSNSSEYPHPVFTQVDFLSFRSFTSVCTFVDQFNISTSAIQSGL